MFRIMSLLVLASAILYQRVESIEPGTISAIAAAASAATGAISSGSSLFGTSVSGLRGGGGMRNLVVEITNHLEKELFGGDYWLMWGRNVLPARPIIKPLTREVVQFDHTWHTATGVEGVLTYNIVDKSSSTRFAISFSVPFSYIHSSNWFGLKFIDPEQTVDKEFYLTLYNDPAWSYPRREKNVQYGYAYEGKPIYVENDKYLIAASMSNDGRCAMSVEIYKKKEKEGGSGLIG